MANTRVFLSGGRIQGRSDDSTSSEAAPDVDLDFTEYADQSAFDTAWVSNDTNKYRGNPTSDYVAFDVDRVSTWHIYHDVLGETVSDTAWILRFKLTHTAFTRSSSSGLEHAFTISMGSGTDGWTTAEDHISLNIFLSNAELGYYGVYGNNYHHYGTGTKVDSGYDPAAHTIYVEMIRTGASTATIKLFSNSDYSTGQLGSTINLAPSSVTNLRYFKIAGQIENTSSGNDEGYIDDFKFYDGITSTTTVTAKDKSSITNVPDGTRYEEVDTRKIFHKRTQTGSGGGDLWVEKGNTFSASALRGFFSGGAASGSRNEIEYITIQTTANATDFGDLIDSREGSGACADATRCLDGHGNSIEYWTATTLGNATDFGDLSASRSPQGGGLADTTRGVFAGGNTTIDYVTIQTTGNATDFGDLQGGYSQTSACADATRGIIGGGWTGAYVDSIDYITIQSAGNAQDFGNLSAGKYALSACSDATRGVFTGGHTGSEINVIEYITIQTLGNTTDFGDLIASNTKHANCADSTRGVSAGGGCAENRIEYFTIQTTGNSTDFGDLVVGREVTGGCAA